MPSFIHRPHADVRPAAPPPRRTAERIQPPELALTALVALNLCFLPWAFGGVDAWSQLVSGGLALAAMIVALLPCRPASPAAGRRAGFRMGTWQRLRRFPIFWAGLALLGYMLAQAMNPAFEYKTDGTAWWLVRLDHVAWLPAGMKAPFGETNSWRSMLLWGTCWLTTCALWARLPHRRTILRLLTALSVNGFVFAAFGIAQRAGGAVKIYGVRSVGFPYFLAAIIYKNHAAAFFSLLTSVTIGLAVHAFWRSRRAGPRSNPGVVLLFFAFILMLAVGLSFSVSGIALFGAGFLVVVAAAIRQYLKAFPASQGNRLPVILTAGVLLLLAAGLGAASGYRDFRYKARVMIEGNASHSLKTRWLAARRGWEMFTDRWAFGWGAGCFEYGFTKYQHKEPELTHWHQFQLRWEHVHDDWLELLIELGVVGSIPVVLMAVCWFREIIRLRLWRKPPLLPLLGGLGALVLYGFFDFPFHNPAVALTAAALLPLIVRWGELESARKA